MATTSATSTSGLSSLGLGSGLDVTSIIASLMKVENAPLTGMQADATKLNTKLSTYGKLQSYVSALGDAAAALAQNSIWAQTTATSSNDSALTATTSSEAAAGAYSIQVTALASGQALASASHASTTEAAGFSGTLTIEKGRWGSETVTDADTGATTQNTTFEPINYPSFVDVAISSSDSLESIRDKINAGNTSVTASIVTDSTGSRLILRSKATGAESGFRVSVADDDGTNGDASGLSSLAYDPSASINAMTRTKSASDASAVVDGLTVSSATNTFTSALQGVSFVAKSVTSSPVDVTVSSDTASMKTSIQAFATAYNDLASYLQAQTKYDAESKTAGSLQGDSAANALRSALRSLGTSTSGSASSFDRLSLIGLDPQSDGTLKVNSSKLDSALAKPDELRKLFGDVDLATTTDDGFATKISDWTRSLLSIDGAITTRQSSLQSQIRANTKEQADFQDRMTSVQARLTAQYSALDTQMSKMSALSTYVTQQIANWNKSTA